MAVIEIERVFESVNDGLIMCMYYNQSDSVAGKGVEEGDCLYSSPVVVAISAKCFS